MNKLQPADDAQLFAYLFLQRLPREVRILLTKEDIFDMQSLAEKADDLIAYHRPQQHDVVAVAAVNHEVTATADEEEPLVAAVRKGSKKKGGKQFKGKKQQSHADSLEGNSLLCWLHIRFGDKARCCEQPCTWPAAEN
jgi:fumarylacetoacetate (FAA) hydrolase family protein